MKILQLCSASEMGGGEVHVADLTRALARRGHELHLAVRPQSPLRDALKDAPVIWHEMPLKNSLDIYSVDARPGAQFTRLSDSMPAGLNKEDLTPPVAVSFPSRLVK